MVEYFHISKEEILSNSREKKIVYLRQIIIYLLRDIFGMLFKTIEIILNKDHSTIIHSYEKINMMLATPKTYKDITNIKDKLYEKHDS
jgi:chromosomal replication initiator protein